MRGNPQLRSLLDTIVSEENAENWWQPELFEKNTHHQLPANLIVLEGPPEEKNNYNCFIFAFDLQKYTPLLGNNGWEYTKKLDTIVNTLITNKTLQRLSTPQSESLVVYRTDEGVISHVGRIGEGGKVTSKWSWGPLIKHALYDVPASYGDTVEYYANAAQGRDALIEHFSRHQSAIL